MTLILDNPLTVKNPIYLSAGNLPAQIAGVAPTLDYRFARDRSEIETVSLTNKLTVTTVDADGTFFDQGGKVQQASLNVPRFNHDPTTGKSLGLLVEEERVNRMLRSEDYSTTWGRTGILAFGSGSNTNATNAPDGQMTADRITETATTALHYTNQAIASVTASSTVTSSVFIKFDSASRNFSMQVNDASGGGSNFYNVNLTSAGVITSSISGTGFTNQSNTLVQCRNGWFRLSATVTTSTVTTITTRQMIVSTSNAQSYVGDGTSGLYLWGAQFEVGAFPTSYTPTTSAAVTRSADSIKIAAGSGVITGTYTMVEKPSGCATVSGTDILLNTGYTAERVMVFPANLSADQITAIRAAM